MKYNNSRNKLLILAAITVLLSHCELIKNKPAPMVIRSSADSSSSRLFNYSVRVKAEVLNSGGDGYVTVDAKVYQSGNEWSKTQNIQMVSGESETVEFVFDEVKWYDGGPKFEVDAYVLGN